MRSFLLVLLTTITVSLYSQDIVQVSIGSSYANQAYYTFENDNVSTIGNNAWDIAFAQTLSFEAGVHVNESITISFVGSSPSTLLYMAPTNNFDDFVDLEAVGDSLYNDELSWGNGALNVPRDTNDFADFGWGKYNPDNHAIEGDQVYVIKLRDDSYRKFMIVSLIGGVYTLKYAYLDGSNEQTVTIDKNDYADKPLILFSFLDDKVLDDLPENYDLIFQRYSDLDPSNVGVMVEYTVTGIVTAPGVQSARATNVEDPETISYEDYIDSLDNKLDNIGQNWKYFSFESGWVIQDDLTFFIKTTANHLWQIYIYDFEGSSTGTYTFAKWDRGVLAGVEDVNSDFNGVSVFPNPVKAESSFSLVMEMKESTPAKISIFNTSGQLVKSFEKSVHTGLNAFDVPTTGLIPGTYYLHLETSDSRISRTLSVN
jgi:hypothetical protein